MTPSLWDQIQSARDVYLLAKPMASEYRFTQEQWDSLRRYVPDAPREGHLPASARLFDVPLKLVTDLTESTPYRLGWVTGTGHHQYASRIVSPWLVDGPSPPFPEFPTISHPVPGGRYLCPVDDCDWHVDVPEPIVSIDPADSRSALTIAGVAPAELDVAMSAHFDTHPPADYLRTIQRLNNEAAMRPTGESS